MLKGGDVESVETKWEMFRDKVKEYYYDVSGVRRVGEQSRKRESVVHGVNKMVW